MKEVRLNNVKDPIRYVANLLRREALLCETLQTSSRPSLTEIYAAHRQRVDECHRDANVAWNRVRRTVVEMATDRMDGERLQKTVVHAVKVAQKVIDLFDDLCVQYSIPEREPFLFAKIGSLLEQ